MYAQPGHSLAATATAKLATPSYGVPSHPPISIELLK